VSDLLPDPPQPPADPPAVTPPADPPADPPAGDGDDLSSLIDRLAKFDPAEIERRLSELDQRVGSSDVVTAIREALGPTLDGLDKTLKNLASKLTGGSATPPAPTAVPDPPAPPASPQGPAGVLDKLFSQPTI
jgi:hypothetical protein